MFKTVRMLACAAALVIAGFAAAEDKIVSIGSDTMSHLIKNTAEAYQQMNPKVKVEVSDPGSSAGIGAMINGQSDICPSSRNIKPEEIEKFADKHNGEKPIEFRVALDGLVIYVNKNNPISQLTMEQIGRIFSGNPDQDVTDAKGKVSKAIGAKITTWGQVDSSLPEKFKNAKIVLYSRNAASGTYGYFKEHCLVNHDFDSTAQEMPGTSAVVNGVAKDEFAIGYGGIGYKTEEVKLLNVAPKEGEPAVAATIESVSARKYPISRTLNIYVPNKPRGVVKGYLSFILSEEGQQIVGSEKVGFVPLPEGLLKAEQRKLMK